MACDASSLPAFSNHLRHVAGVDPWDLENPGVTGQMAPSIHCLWQKGDSEKEIWRDLAHLAHILVFSLLKMVSYLLW